MRDMVFTVDNEQAKHFAKRLRQSKLDWDWDRENYQQVRFRITDGWASKTALKMWNRAKDLECQQ